MCCFPAIGSYSRRKGDFKLTAIAERNANSILDLVTALPGQHQHHNLLNRLAAGDAAGDGEQHVELRAQ